MAVVQIGMMTMGVADTIMVGRVSANALASVALGNLYFFNVVIFGMGVLYALDPLISQAVGAGDGAGIGRALQRGIVLSLGLTVIGSLLLVPGRPLLTALGQPEEVVPVAVAYAHVSIPGIFPFYLFIVLRQTLQALGRVAPIVLTVVVANVANVLLNWVLIHGKLGFPAMGAVGSGWASTAARWILALLLLGIAWPLLRPWMGRLRREALELKPLLRMAVLGIPIGLQLFLEFGAFAVTAILMGWLGTVPVASHQIALNLASLTFMVPLGVAQASAVRTGQAVGRGDPPGARRAAGAGLLVGAGFMVASGLLFLTVPRLLAGVYTQDPAVLALAALLIPVAGIFQVFDGLQVVASALLRGVGDTRAPMVVNLLGFWLLGMPVGWVLGFHTPAGPVGLWWGLAVGLAAVATVLLLRVRQRFGGDLRRLVIDDVPVAAH